jgi:allophanate hydrolase
MTLVQALHTSLRMTSVALQAAHSLSGLSLDLAALRNGYTRREFTPLDVAREVLRRLAAAPERHAWISRVSDAQILEFAEALNSRRPESLPLYGVPFAIKDNIDLAGLPTTAACPAFAYSPRESAFCVQRLIAAGAMPVGKTNLDQFATGLVGTRSPYGACRNSFDPDYISGGSSSGSAVAVATGVVSFALGTDTAGSGRVPAGFNNLVGYKPTCGLISPRGMVPACRTLDSISVFALTAADAGRVGEVAAGFDPAEPFSRAPPAGVADAPDAPDAITGFGRWRCAVPRADQLQFFGNEAYRSAFEQALRALRRQGVEFIEIDFAPFLEVAKLLYEGPWIAERYVALADLLVTQPDAIHPVTRGIIAQGAHFTAAEAFRGQYRLLELRRHCEEIWRQCEMLVTPTAGSIYRIEEVLADPVALNSQLGYYTNFVNLLDLAAVAVPAGMTTTHLPFGITLIAPAWHDARLLQRAAAIQPLLNRTLGATDTAVPAAAAARPRTGSPSMIEVVVCGAHMAGLPLNRQLLERGATLSRCARTAPIYRLYALPGGPPYRPGLVQVDQAGAAIEVEVWSVPAAHFGSFVAGIPAPLAIGKIRLEDGSEAPGFVCEPHGISIAADITHLRGWRRYLEQIAAVS